MSVRSKRRSEGPSPIIENMLDSMLDAALGASNRSKASGSRSTNRTRFEAPDDEPQKNEKVPEEEEIEFIFPSPGSLTPEEEEEPEEDIAPPTPIHESVDLLEKMTGDRKPAMRFCPADPPAGSKPYDPGALSKNQQRRLNHLKRGVARDDQRYLSQHPEIGAVCSLLLTAILRDQPKDVRDFCSKYVKRPEMRHEVDEFVLRYPPPSRHDDIAEVHDWFPEPDLDEEDLQLPITKPAEDALKKMERAQRRSRMYDHRATILHRDLIRQGAEDMVRRWLDDMLTTALSHRTDYWEHFEEAQELVTDELEEKRKLEDEIDEAEVIEAEKAVTEALKSLHKRVEVVDVQKKAGAFISEAPGEDWVETGLALDRQREEGDRVEAVAAALQKLRTVSRGGAAYMAALSEAITRLQEHRAGELDTKPTSLSERALRWSAIVRGERASVMMHKQEMEEKALRLAAAVAKTDRKKSTDQAAVTPFGFEEEDEEEVVTETRKDKKKRRISKKDLEEYNLRLSLVFPELADMLHDEGDGQQEVKDMPFQEQMAAATKDALELATKRFKAKPDKRTSGRKGGSGMASTDVSLSGEVTPDADAKALRQRHRQKRLPTAIVFEGLDPRQMKEKLHREAQAKWPPPGMEEEVEDYSEMGTVDSDAEVDKKRDSAASEKSRASTKDEAKKSGKLPEIEEQGEEAEGEAEESVAGSETDYQKVSAEGADQGRDSQRAADKLRAMSQSSQSRKTATQEEEEEEKPDEPATDEQAEKSPEEEAPQEEPPRKSSVSTKPQTPDPPTPGDASD